ncbi:MAG: VOC family protein [Candidatus Bathyarchaeota archaeon]
MLFTLDHTAITVKDLDRSIHFYSKILSFQLLSRKKNIVLNVEYALVQVGQSRIEILSPIEGEPSDRNPVESGMEGVASELGRNVGWNHIALRIDSMEELCKVLKASGVRFVMEPKLMGSGSKIAFITDPDGNLIELIQRP